MWKKFLAMLTALWNSLFRKKSQVNQLTDAERHREQVDQDTRRRAGIVMPDGTFIEAPEGGFTLNGTLGNGKNELRMSPTDPNSKTQEKMLNFNTNTVHSTDDNIREGNLEAVDLMVEQIVGASSMERTTVAPNEDGTPRGKSSYLRQIDAETFECDLCGTHTTLSEETAYNADRIAHGVMEYGVIGACYHCEQDNVLSYATALYNKNVNSASRVVLLEPRYVVDWAASIGFRSADRTETDAALAFQRRRCQISSR